MAAAAAVKAAGSTAVGALHLVPYNPPKLWEAGVVKAAENVVAPAKQAALRAVAKSGDAPGVVRRLLRAWERVDMPAENGLKNDVTRNGKRAGKK